MTAPIREELSLFTSSWLDGEWAIAEQMLRDLDQLFRQHNIEYFICYGTFLGAVRHRGVIPWDDDIDLGILEKDEDALRQLEKQLDQMGYGLRNWSTAWNNTPMQYYKVWVNCIEPQLPLPYSWPFVDILVFRQDSQADRYQDGMSSIKREDLTPPLSRYPFGELSLPGPNSLQPLVDEFGADYASKCISNGYDHKFEKARKTATASLVELQQLGYCPDVHAVDRFRLSRTPERKQGVQLVSNANSTQLVDGLSHFALNETMHYVWDRLDGEHSLAEIVDEVQANYTLPRVQIMVDIFQAMRLLSEQALIRLK